MFGGSVFQQTVGIPMGNNCAPLLAELFLYSYETDFIQGLLKKNEKRFDDFVDRIYPIEYEIKDTTDTAMHVSYLDPRLEMDKKGPIKNETLRQKHDFNFPIVNFPFIGRIFLQYLHMGYISLS